MTKYLLLTCTLIFLSACSFTKPKNEWQINSINAYDSYKEYYLKGEDNLASTDMKRAVKYAKQSADLNTLARIYVSECALHVGVLEGENCAKYLNVKNLAASDELYSYYQFLQDKLAAENIKFLPSKYQRFATYKLNNDLRQAESELLKMDDIVSKMICASLVKDSLHVDTIKILIDEASFYGYKKAVINWMVFYKIKTTDLSEKNLLGKKLQILKD
ncbi:hypothetical protein KKA17_00045 [bacterium]|nr:hypothetical protein [bacterium]MBU1884148.1 hypothetical protein [bacterium]